MTHARTPPPRPRATASPAPRPAPPRSRWALLMTIAVAPQLANANGGAAPPVEMFVQAGIAEDAQTLTIGVVKPWSWERTFAAGRATGYWEASFGRWSSELDRGGPSTAWVTQLGVTPVLRWFPQRWDGRGFVEAGIGANLLLPIYRSRDKRFSTAFNFGDHVALGWRFGAGQEHEVSLRLQHFSNAGIRKPNPGEDFIQFRWGWRH